MKRGATVGITVAAAVVLGGAVAPLALAETAPGNGVPSSGLAQFYSQRPAWGPCPAPDWPDLPGFPAPQPPEGVECATVQVPRDYRRPDGPRESVDLSRKPASDPARRLGVLIPVPGGPGGSNLTVPEDSTYDALSVRYDLIGISPRGVAESQPLLCEGENVQRAARTRMTDAEMREYAEELRRHDQECERTAGDRRPHVTSANNARDLDVVRAVLGESKLNLMGQSYGTYVTAVYGSLFPDRLDRNVLDSAIHPEWTWREAWRQQPIAQRKTADAWMTWVAQRNETYGLGGTRKAVHATIEELRRDLEATPVEIDEGWFDGAHLDLAVGGMYEAPDWDYFAETVRTLRTALDNGRAVPGNVKRALAVQRNAIEDELPEMDAGVWESTNCEAEWPRDLETYFADMRDFAKRYPYGWGATGAGPHECTFGSVERVEPLVQLRRNDYPAGLVVQQEFDPATPYEGGPAMANLLGHRLLTVTRDGVHVSYGSNECVTAAVDAYFLAGTLPKAKAECAGRPTPEVPADGSPGAGEVERPSLDEHTRAKEASLTAVSQRPR
jgi:pimeloyl-ACP methyl ester carboxylesterase